MADTYSMGIPNQGLKALVNTYVTAAPNVTPVEFDADTVDVLTAATERDLVATQTVAANRKVYLDSLIVNVPIADAIVSLYRNGSVVESWIPKTTDQSIQLFPVNGGKEFDEGETWKITVISATGSGSVAHGSVSGRQEVKRNELFSQVLA